nr:PREDICTED: uncharacterized protein LOC107077864 isoform X2 [Lepisosteus oculatus]
MLCELVGEKGRVNWAAGREVHGAHKQINDKLAQACLHASSYRVVLQQRRGRSPASCPAEMTSALRLQTLSLLAQFGIEWNQETASAIPLHGCWSRSGFYQRPQQRLYWLHWEQTPYVWNQPERPVSAEGKRGATSEKLSRAGTLSLSLPALREAAAPVWWCLKVCAPTLRDCSCLPEFVLFSFLVCFLAAQVPGTDRVTCTGVAVWSSSRRDEGPRVLEPADAVAFAREPRSCTRRRFQPECCVTPVLPCMSRARKQ